MCSRTTSENWHFGKISLWQPEQSLAGETVSPLSSHDPLTLTVNTKHGPGWHLSREGKGSHPCFHIYFNTLPFRALQDLVLYSYIWGLLTKRVDINILRRENGDQVVVRVMVVCLSLFSLTVVTCVKSPNAKVTRKCFQWSSSWSSTQVGPSSWRCFQWNLGVGWEQSRAGRCNIKW